MFVRKHIYKLHPGPTIKTSTKPQSTPCDYRLCKVALDLVLALTAVGQVNDLSIAVYQLINA